MSARPIIFSGESVRAILAGRKTVTRRVVKRQPPDGAVFQRCDPETFSWDATTHSRRLPGGVTVPAQMHFTETSRYMPGDVLWVRETWGLSAAIPMTVHERILSDRLCANPAWLGYRADGEGGFCWRPSIFMPRWASRLSLLVESVRVERLQEIIEEDAQAEGVTPPRGMSHVYAFANGWDALNGRRLPKDAFRSTKRRAGRIADSVTKRWPEESPYSWAANPWVWRIAFSRVDSRTVPLGAEEAGQ